MTDSDDDQPDNLFPLGHEIPFAIAEQLRVMYEGFLSEQLPERLSALLKQFEQLAQKDSESKT